VLRAPVAFGFVGGAAILDVLAFTLVIQRFYE
jgi:hypothetical protein